MSLNFYRLQQLISPSLPIGAFTYSQGIEWAVECGWIKNAADLKDWLHSGLYDSLLWLDLPLLLRLYQACQRKKQCDFERWSDILYAHRETSELRKEENQRAQALMRVLNQLLDAADCPQRYRWQSALNKTVLAGFALAAYHWQIPQQTLLAGYSWSWLENMVNVAVKLVPLGQSDGQQILYQLSELLPDICVQASEVDDQQIGASTPALAIASSLHETQYCRLFQS